MFFSFIVPVYNTSKYLNRCIESILCQKGADYEILLVDDGSTDNSGKLCDQYAKQYPEIVRVIHKQNEGSLLTRHKGIMCSHGDWIICVDSDDYISSHFLVTINEIILNNNPDMILFHYAYFNEIGNIISAKPVFSSDKVFELNQKEEVLEKRLTGTNLNSMCLKAIRRDIMDFTIDYANCGIRNLCDDAVEVLPLLTNAKRIVSTNKVLYYYRKGHESTTASRTYSNWQETKSCFLLTEEYLEKWDVADELRKKFYTYNVEVLSNFLRWVFRQVDNQLPKSVDSIIHEINIHPAFQRCMQMYQKQYAKTAYLKFSVPIIMRYVQKENVKRLKRYFALEGKVLSRR